MAGSQDVPEAVSQRLRGFVSQQRSAVSAESPDAALLIDAAESALAGGKRLRARFCETGWRSVSPAVGSAAIIDAAAALEIFQAAALVHDDIIDNSDTRRGRPSAHRALEAMHRAAGWTGDAAAFGRSGALLLGDLLVAWSDDLFESALATLADPALARDEYARMRRDVTLGQFLDIAQESAWIVQPDDTHADRALEVASLKSARYSVVQPLVIGGALGGGSAPQLDALRRFGMPVGLAFQLRDDVLGVFGDSSVTGKPTGDDLREGKRTLLVAYAREGMSDADRAAFDARLGDVDLEEASITRMQDGIRDTGALARVEERIAQYQREADAALAAAPLTADAIEELSVLADAATRRSA
ncbi:polyprenyl synthetase family protein [Microbacterium gorillae]|uniref:polyprenyl synthetase family protein n=1 Tax=Microbacterium gorillae TaxID=1231063 RepID=UPI00058D8555|nr:polyprenyl synthetase family protein [Microbacterium gorillae]